MEKSDVLKVDQPKGSKLIDHYLAKDNKLSDFVGDFPSIKTLLEKTNSRAFSEEKRGVLVEAIRRQYKGCQIEVPNLVNELSQSGVFTITTGHQLALYGGPKYFIHKIVSVIKLSRELSVQMKAGKCLPVFWLASEDHDYDEINQVKNFSEKIESKKVASGAVGRLPATHFKETLVELRQLIGTSESANHLIELFENAFQKMSWSDFTRYWVHELFEGEVIIVDGDDRGLKQLMIEFFKKELVEQQSIKSIESSSAALENLGFHTQVTARDINLFYLGDGLRERIVKTDEGFAVLNTSIRFTEQEILEELASFPERFSPNAVLRPLYEEVILPNIAYIGGPGELAYWMQLKQNFDEQGVEYPSLILRDSFVLVKKSDLEILNKYQISFEELSLREDELDRIYLERNEAIKLNFSDEKEALKKVTDQISIKVNKMAKNYDTMLGAEFQRWNNFFKKLEKRAMRNAKFEEEVALRRLRGMQEKYFPKGKLNERSEGLFEDFLILGKDKYLETLLNASDPMESSIKIVTVSN